MELTPIRVRGKRRARGEKLVVARSPKRLKKDRSRKRQVKDGRPKASEIEKSLPLEILEHIFWLSENVNFPRAGPRLGRLLSGPSTLRGTFLSAFGPTWDVWFGCVNGAGIDFPAIHSYAGWETDTDRFGGNPSFQTDLLACSWTTIDLILDCRDIWVRRHARNLPFQHFPLWGSPIEASSYTGGISDITEARHYFYRDYNAFRNIELPTENTYTTLGTEHPNHNTWIEVHRYTEIPDGLITGPWDEGSLQKFFWLVQGGARLSSGQTWEITREGFSNALADPRAPNLTAIRLLRVLGSFLKWPISVTSPEWGRLDTIFPISERRSDERLRATYAYIEAAILDYH